VFDKNDFVESVIERGLGLDEIVSEARVDIRLIESHAVRLAGSSDYAGFLHSLVFFLEGELKAKPANLSADDFQLVLHLAWHLVGRGDLEPDILELFGE